jgi:hypothetical protein
MPMHIFPGGTLGHSRCRLAQCWSPNVFVVESFMDELPVAKEVRQPCTFADGSRTISGVLSMFKRFRPIVGGWEA